MRKLDGRCTFQNVAAVGNNLFDEVAKAELLEERFLAVQYCYA